MDYDDSILSHCIAIHIKPNNFIPGILFKDLKIPNMKNIPYENDYIDFNFNNARLITICKSIRYNGIIIFLYHENFPKLSPHIYIEPMSILDAQTNYPWLFNEKEILEQKDPILYRDFTFLKKELNK